MRKIIFLIFIFNILNIVPSYSVESYVSNESYTICATDANGAILINEEGNEDLSSFALASDPTNFNLIDRGNINDEEADMGASCDITPDNYKMKFFKTGFCLKNPYREPVDAASNTINADLSSCVSIFDKAAGKEVVIQPDAEIDLLEGELILPIGSYPFQFAILDNVVQIKHEQVFVAAPGAGNFNILGYNPDNNDKNDPEHKGKICYTSTNDAGDQFVSVQSNELGVTGSTTLRGYTLPVRNTGIQPSALFRCRSSVGTGNDAPDYMPTILNSFGSPMCTYSPEVGTCTRDTSKFRNAGRQDAGFSKIFPKISQAYYLLKSDNTIATTPENVRRILWLQYDPDNLIRITENTVGLKFNFKTNNAMQMQIHQDGSDNFARDTELMANQIHGGTIIGQIQVKNRRSRGAWR
jgi:hypothetical protein